MRVMFAAICKTPAHVAIAIASSLQPLVAASQPAPGFADAVLGRWDLTIRDADDAYPAWLEVRLRTESELMGRFVGRFGSVRHLAAIDFDAGALTFTAPVQYERGDRPLQFAGTIGDDELAGTLIDSTGRELLWSGLRAPPLLRGGDARPAPVVELFNRRDMSGWRARRGSEQSCWNVVDGELTVMPPCVDIVSTQRFDDFELRAEFRIPPGSNSGIYLRGRYEVQIQDTAGQALDALRMGAVYGFTTPSSDAALPPNTWQTLLVRLVGREVTVVLNETTIIDAETIPGITGGALDSAENEPGPIMIQGDHGAIAFRRIELTPLVQRTD